MWACRAAVALLVVLIEGVRTPEAAIATWLGTRILPPTLVELVFVALPVVLELEARLTGSTPVDVSLASGSCLSSVNQGSASWRRRR